jgi:hypothetical protein
MSLRELLARKRTGEDKKQTLLCACVAAAIKGDIPFEEFKNITEWLGVYAYVYPADRSVSFDMMAFLTKGIAKTEEPMRARKVFKAWLLADLMETCLTEKQQSIVLGFLKGE